MRGSTSSSGGLGEVTKGASIDAAGTDSDGAKKGTSVGGAGATNLPGQVGDSWKSAYLLASERRQSRGFYQPRIVGKSNAEINGN